MSRRLAVAALVLVVVTPAGAAQPQFWKVEGARDFLDGDLEGLAVDSEGRVRLSPDSRVLHDPEAPYVWCLARDPKGALYAGTGNDGKIYRIEDGRGAPFYDASELEIHALAFGPDGRLYAGTAPDGKVYAIDAAGKAEVFFDPTDKYIWALSFDRQGSLLVSTGAEGKVYRVDKQGKGQVFLTSPDTHVLSLAVDDKGSVYAGSSPGGIVYRVDPQGRVFVLHDSAYREVKAIDVGADGSLYVAVIDGKEKEEGPRPAAPPVAPVIAMPAGGEVTVTESFMGVVAAGVVPSPAPRTTVEAPRPGTAKGAVLRILPSGEVDTLWSSAEDTPHSLVAMSDGALVGTGDKGKLYRVRHDRSWTMVGSFAVQQVTALVRGTSGGVLLGASNPGKVFDLEASPGKKGTFTSKAKDTETVSTWGRIRWEAHVPPGADVQIQTRSGNTSAPDTTWSDWSPRYAQKDGDPVTSERARFLQVRAVLAGKDGASPLLDSVSTAYLQRNLRPQVVSISVHPPGEIFQKPLSLTGELEILGLEPGEGPERPPASQSFRAGLPPATTYSRKLYQKGLQTFSWKAEDPNGDTLAYDVYYRPAEDARFRLLRKDLTDAVLAWDTSTVPNGRYVIKVLAKDDPSNPDTLALSGDKESVPFDVDNTPPTAAATLSQAKPPRVRATVRDDSSLIRKAEYSVDGGKWEVVHPVDGINDALEETYEFSPGDLAGPGPHVVVVRATDLLGNVATARVEIP